MINIGVVLILIFVSDLDYRSNYICQSKVLAILMLFFGVLRKQFSTERFLLKATVTAVAGVPALGASVPAAGGIPAVAGVPSVAIQSLCPCHCWHPYCCRCPFCCNPELVSLPLLASLLLQVSLLLQSRACVPLSSKGLSAISHIQTGSKFVVLIKYLI